MDKEYYIKKAINEAKLAQVKGDIPVGAIIVQNDKIIGKGHNLKEQTKNPIKHAEIIAIEKACATKKDFRLEDCDIYITKEPCLMCMGAILSARIRQVYFGAFDPRYGTMGLAKDNKFNHSCNIEGGVLEEECSKLLSDFFKNLRSNDAGTDTKRTN